MKKAMVLLVVMILLILVTAQGLGDFGRSGSMISPTVLVLVPASRMTDRFWAKSENYTWSYAPLYFKPDEREATEACGPAPTDPAVYASATPLKLPDSSKYTIKWKSGWDPDKVSVSSWDIAVYQNPDKAADYSFGTEELTDDQIALEPDRIYQFHAEWVKDYPDEEEGQADYYIVTKQMTDEEKTLAENRSSAPFSEEDLRFLTLKINGVECILGETTPQDLADRGLVCDIDFEGTISISMEDGYSTIYASNTNSKMDDPICMIDAFWAYEIPVEYCGFNGVIEDPETDPDNIWLPEEDRWTAEDLKELEEDEDAENSGLWGGMISWMGSLGYLEESVEGIYSTVVTLSNGRELEISSHDSPVGLYLLP